MDKYEYKVRAGEIKELIAEGEYAQAAEIADTIDWRRVKSVMMLCTISDLYKINRRYEDAKNMLLLAYERRPGGKTICYSLCELCIKTEDFIHAVNYYKEFVQVAPKDSGRYILQYRIYEAQDVGLEERIGVLEELKKRDYREKWAYELAYLYHRVGLATRCVEECDELILWFGEGKYVIKAMELKMLHQPLTAAQQEKYDHRFEPWSAPAEMGAAEEVISDSQTGWEPTAEEPPMGMQAEMLPEGAYGRGNVQESPEELDIQVKTMDVGQYNTINLQAEIAAGLQEVLSGDQPRSEAITRSILAPLMDSDTESLDMPEIDEVDESDLDPEAEVMEGEEVFFGETGELGSVRQEAFSVRSGAEAPPAAGKSPEEEGAADTDNTAELVMKQLRMERAGRGEEQALTAQPPRELAGVLAQESDGQISLVVPETEKVEKQITGQMNLEDILVEWEKVKKENEEKRREEVRKRVIEQTGNMFTEFEAAVRDGLLEKLENEKPEQAEAEEELEEVMLEDEGSEEEPEDVEGEDSEGLGGEFEGLDGELEGLGGELEGLDGELEGLGGELEGLDGELEGLGEEFEGLDGEFEALGEESYGEEPGDAEGEDSEDLDGELEDLDGEFEALEEESYGEEPEDAEGEDSEGLGGELEDLEGEFEALEEKSYGEEPGDIEGEDSEGLAGELEGLAEEFEGLDGELEGLEEESYGEEPEDVEGEDVEGEDVEGLDGELEGLDEELEDPDGEFEDLEEESEALEEEGYGEESGNAEGEDSEGLEGALEALEEESNGEKPEALEKENCGKEGGDTGGDEAEGPGEKVKDSEGASGNPEANAGREEPPKTKKARGGEPVEGKSAEPERKKKPTGRKKIETAQKQEARRGASAVPVEREKARVRALTKEEKELYNPYIQSRSAREKLVKAIDSISMAAYTGNIIITGDTGMDTLTLAKNMIREVQLTDSNFSGKVAKITGQGINDKNVEDTLEKLKSGALIIQEASGMKAETVEALHKALQQERLGIIVVLEDTKRAIDKMLSTYSKLKECFTARMDVEALSNDMLVAYGRKYAREMEYSIDELGVLALHTRIEERQAIDHAVTALEVKEMVDDAIHHANRKTLGHFFDILFAKRYDDEDMIVLTENDFV